jgi:hypothetical protein
LFLLARSDVARQLRLALLFLLLAVVGRTVPARADAPEAQLTWATPEGGACSHTITAASIEREVEQLVGHPVFVSANGQANLVLRGGATLAPDGLHAWFEARDASGALAGRRELNEASGDCGALQHSAALVLSILLDHPRGAAEPSAEPHERVARRLSGSAGVSAWSGPLPRLAPGFWLSLELGLTTWLRVRADGAYWLPVEKEAGEQGAGGRAGGTLSAVTGGLAICPIWSPGPSGGRVRVGACLGGQAGSFLATPMGLDQDNLVARLLAQATLEVGVSVRVQRLTTLFVSAGPALALTRPRFYYTREDAQRRGAEFDVYRPEKYGMIARIGMTIGAP